MNRGGGIETSRVVGGDPKGKLNGGGRDINEQVYEGTDRNTDGQTDSLVEELLS